MNTNTTLNKKSWMIAAALVLVLAAMATRPEQAAARSGVVVSAYSGGFGLVVGSTPCYAYSRAPGYVYSVEPRYRIPPPPPPRAWYRHHPPPPPYWYRDRHHHRHHHRHPHWHRDRW